MKLSCVLEILSYPYHLTPSKQVKNSSFNPVTEPYEKIKPTDESRLQFNYSAVCCLKTVSVYTSLCVWRVCSLAYLESQEFAFHQGVKHLRTQTQLTGHTHTHMTSDQTVQFVSILPQLNAAQTFISLITPKWSCERR